MNSTMQQPAYRSRQPVIVALSGGVDSAVAALVLQQAGHVVEGLFVVCWPSSDPSCSADLDFQEASAVAADLGIVLHRVSLVEAYRSLVLDPFLAGLRQGLTPNPDLLCNQAIKFGLLKAHALRLGAAWFATGHHARLERGTDGRVSLLRGADADKDQSYFLATLGQGALRHTLFPIGHLTKEEVRAMARRHGLRNHDRHGTTGLCLVGPRRFDQFVHAHLPMPPGPIQTWEGHTLAQRHLGLARYTIGQRAGLGLGAIKGVGDGPWFVADKRLEDNALVIVSGENHPALYRSMALCQEAHWIGQAPSLQQPLAARIRYRQESQSCMVHPTPHGGLVVHFERPQRALTPGQAIVFYEGAVCLGAAMIQESLSMPQENDPNPFCNNHAAACRHATLEIT
jgi:tRNA-specific 2-thiouridylase